MFADMWYNEVNSYDFYNQGFTSDTGHFTQLVWQSTTQLGCGIGINDQSNSVYGVCNYVPPGNVDGEFEDNVSAPNQRKRIISLNMTAKAKNGKIMPVTLKAGPAKSFPKKIAA